MYSIKTNLFVKINQINLMNSNILWIVVKFDYVINIYKMDLEINFFFNYCQIL